MPDDAQHLVPGGHLVAEALKAEGVDRVYTLCGGHLIDIYDDCVDEGGTAPPPRLTPYPYLTPTSSLSLRTVDDRPVTADDLIDKSIRSSGTSSVRIHDLGGRPDPHTHRPW
ncbi:hypothetical protein [Streptomyces sp. BP-8]|uniref:Thiamine pyrophosphate enzyme N-terminal TPP-binding domain-containing protein n=1 Tax=Streptomyces sirii TaxID=3127701 RepID=A0ABZ2R5L3_9ACTN